MTIENRDMHTYNCDVYITHNDDVYQVPVANGLEISWERKGAAGKCTFSVIQEDDGELQFEEGDTVRVRISKTWMFYGFIFTLNRSKDRIVKITCYDQLRYLKSKESAVFVNKTVGEIVTMIANDRRLNKGAIRDSKYKIPSITKENSTYFDMIMTAIEKTTEATGEIFILYDHFGKLTLCPLKHMYRNVVINASVIGDFDYESTIDKQTYNVIRVGYKSQKDGSTVYQTWKDEKSIAKWGMLQLTEKANNSFNAVTIGNQLLNMYNSKTKTLKIKNAMGANEVVAGSVIMVNLDLGDIVISNNMVVDAVTHKIEDGLYSMDLELIGGEFVSTRGVTSDQATNGNSKNSSVIGASDWGHGVTAAMMNRVLKGPLSGMGEKFVQLGNAYGVNPMLVAMIIRIESRPGMNSGLALKGNNFGGINAIKGFPTITMGGRAYAKFPSVDVGIEQQFRLLGVRYINDWKKKSIKDIIMTYAPPHENDTTGYINNLKSFYKQNTGVTWSESLLGSGVSSAEEAQRRMSMRIETNNSTPYSTLSGGYPAHVEEARKHIGKNWNVMKTLGRMSKGLWCCDFTVFCMKKAGNMPVADTSSTRDLHDKFEAKGKAKHLQSAWSYTPKSGDIIFFNNGSARAGTKQIDHVGIVEKVEGGKITTIEGNAGRSLNVCRNTYWVGQKKITGYGIM